MAVGDYYQLIDLQRLNNQQVVNVYFYEQLAAVAGFPTPAQSLYTAWLAQVRPSLLAIQSTTLTHTGIRVYNLFNPTDMYELDYSSPVPGGASGDAMPTFMAWGFTSPRIDRSIRAGKRRLAGISETDTTGAFPASGAVTRLNLAAGAFNTDLDAGTPTVTDSFVPIIVKRIKEVAPSGDVAYRLPENSGEGHHVMSHNWAFQAITTQNSRKIGNGS